MKKVEKPSTDLVEFEVGFELKSNGFFLKFVLARFEASFELSWGRERGNTKQESEMHHFTLQWEIIGKWTY